MRIAALLLVMGCSSGKIPRPQTPGPTDTGSTDDSDVTLPSDTGDRLTGCYVWDPIDVVGATRTYDAVLNGETGIEVHTGLGRARFEGTGVWAMAEEFQGTSYSRALTRFAQCDVPAPGLYRHGFEGTWSDAWLGVPDVNARYNGAWQVAPDASQVGAVGRSWQWAYDLELESDDGTVTAKVPVTGTSTDMGLQNVKVGAGRFVDTWHVQTTYTSDLRQVTPFGQASGVVSGTVDTWYAQRVGVIKEVVEEGGVTTYSRELTGYTGL